MVLSEQGSLWSFQDLNARHVIGGHVRAYGRNRDVVHINDHAWRAATDRQVTNAAKSDRDIVLATFRSEGEARCDGCQRSEEHTSELQSLMRNSYAVFCSKKKQKPQ